MKGMQSPRAAPVLTAAVALVLAGCAVGSGVGGPGPAGSSAAAPAASPSPSASSSRPTARKPSRSAPARPTSLLAEVHDPGRVTGTLTGPCRARDDGRLPDRRCTPGAIDPAVTQADIGSTICVTGYTKTVRPPESQTEAFKLGQAYPAYGLPPGTSSELDHLVPLELGGANDAANLWPEAGPVPNPKDAVEDSLHTAVCDGQVPLARAQRAIARDWETALSSLGLRATSPVRSAVMSTRYIPAHVALG